MPDSAGYGSGIARRPPDERVAYHHRMIARRKCPRGLGALVLVAGTIGGIGCGGGGGNDQPAADARLPLDAPPPPPWWQPQIGTVKNWDIQLVAPIDLATPRVMYDLDLWSVVPAATTLDDGDGAPITVPAGSLPGAIAQLHATTPPTKVVCHFDTGMLDLSLPDAAKFPGYHADPAMIPDHKPPEAGSAIGWRVGTSQKRWLDLRAASRPAWTKVLFARFALAKQIGCDGVDTDGNSAGGTSDAAGLTGFAITANDSLSWFADIVTAGHAQELSTGMRDGDNVASQIDASADKFDWEIIERCGEPDFEDCDVTRPFVNEQKAVFAIDYDHDLVGDPQSSLAVCQAQGAAMIADGIFKDFPPSKTVRTQCQP
jgi:hypothetical protein